MKSRLHTTHEIEVAHIKINIYKQTIYIIIVDDWKFNVFRKIVNKMAVYHKARLNPVHLGSPAWIVRAGPVKELNVKYYSKSLITTHSICVCIANVMV